jgi:hypothetical protein
LAGAVGCADRFFHRLRGWSGTRGASRGSPQAGRAAGQRDRGLPGQPAGHPGPAHRLPRGRAGAAGGRLARRLPGWPARPGRPLPRRAADRRGARRPAAQPARHGRPLLRPHAGRAVRPSRPAPGRRPPLQPVRTPAWGQGDRRVADARRPTP